MEKGRKDTGTELCYRELSLESTVEEVEGRRLTERPKTWRQGELESMRRKNTRVYHQEQERLTSQPTSQGKNEDSK